MLSVRFVHEDKTTLYSLSYSIFFNFFLLVHLGIEPRSEGGMETSLSTLKTGFVWFLRIEDGGGLTSVKLSHLLEREESLQRSFTWQAKTPSSLSVQDSVHDLKQHPHLKCMMTVLGAIFHDLVYCEVYRHPQFRGQSPIPMIRPRLSKLSPKMSQI